MSSPDQPVFELENVSYRYQGAVALNRVSLRIPGGCRVALLGANGSGKSTLLRLLDALIFPQEGILRFRGEPLTEARLGDDGAGFEFRRSVGFLFQNPEVQLFSATVFDEIAFGPLQLGWPRDRIRERVTEMLALLEIKELRDRSPHQLSGGEKKRVALASVLALDPAILLLDEPTAALDPRNQSRMIDYLIDAATASKTVITATHDLNSLPEIADLCFVFDHGELVASGEPLEILDRIDLLERTNLVHSHRHRHGSLYHSHPHRHSHEHHDPGQGSSHYS